MFFFGGIYMTGSVRETSEQCRILSLTWEKDDAVSIGRISWQTGDRRASVPLSIDAFLMLLHDGTISHNDDVVDVRPQDRSIMSDVFGTLMSLLQFNAFHDVRQFSITWRF